VACRSRYRTKNTGPDFFDHPTKGRALNPIVAVYNSQLVAIEVPEDPQGASLGNVPTIATFKAEEPLTNESLYTDRIAKVKDTVNALSTDNMRRGALNHNHLESPVLWAGQSEVARAGHYQIPDAWPGYDTSTYSGAYGPVPGPSILKRHPVFAEKGDYSYKDILKLDIGDPLTGFDLGAQKCFLVVMANVGLQRLSAGHTEKNHNLLATFALGYKLCAPSASPTYSPSGDHWFVPQETVCHTTNSNVQDKNKDSTSGVYFNREVNCDVPLMWIVDMTKRSTTWSQLNSYSTDGWSGRNLFSIHLLASMTPKGVEPHAPLHVEHDGYRSEFSTRNGHIEIKNANISAFILRY